MDEFLRSCPSFVVFLYPVIFVHWSLTKSVCGKLTSLPSMVKGFLQINYPMLRVYRCVCATLMGHWGLWVKGNSWHRLPCLRIQSEITGIEFRLLGLEASAFTHCAISLAPIYNLHKLHFIYFLWVCICMFGHMWRSEDNLHELVFLYHVGSRDCEAWHLIPLPAEPSSWPTYLYVYMYMCVCVCICI